MSIMTIAEQIEADLNQSLKSGDRVRTGTLRLLRGACHNERIKLGHELSDDEVLRVLQRESKQRRDSIEAYTSAGRPELAAAEEAEQGVIDGYLPQPLTHAELLELVRQVIDELGSPNAAAMGRVIGEVMARAGARADGGRVAKVVREQLA